MMKDVNGKLPQIGDMIEFVGSNAPSGQYPIIECPDGHKKSNGDRVWVDYRGASIVDIPYVIINPKQKLTRSRDIDEFLKKQLDDNLASIFT